MSRIVPLEIATPITVAMPHYSAIAANTPPETPKSTDAVAMNSRWDQLTPENSRLLLSWPPLLYVEGPRLAQALGIPKGRLRKWRCRNQGPGWEPRQGIKTDSNPEATFYLVGKIWAWLNGAPPEDAWIYSRAWILERFIGHTFGPIIVSEALTQAEVERVAVVIRELFRFVEFRQSTRVTSMPGPQPKARPQFALSHPKR